MRSCLRGTRTSSLRTGARRWRSGAARCWACPRRRRRRAIRSRRGRRRHGGDLHGHLRRSPGLAGGAGPGPARPRRQQQLRGPRAPQRPDQPAALPAHGRRCQRTGPRQSRQRPGRGVLQRRQEAGPRPGGVEYPPVPGHPRVPGRERGRPDRRGDWPGTSGPRKTCVSPPRCSPTAPATARSAVSPAPTTAWAGKAGPRPARRWPRRSRTR